MKKHLLLFVLIAFLSTQISAQNDIILNINHKLGDEHFALNTRSFNNLGNDFNVSRLQYYISEISIEHDGGMITEIEDFWILADASERTNVNLGNYNINSVEKVNLHVGVEKSHNHLDPTSYPSSHPLAPKFPEMHWGWAAGYRFACFEGQGGTQLNQKFELHGLGDDNYFKTEIPVTAASSNNQVEINIDADYSGLLENINVTRGVIVHGDYGAAKKSIENFRDFVFSASSTSASTLKLGAELELNIFPNPTIGGSINLIVNSSVETEFDVLIMDVLGKIIGRLEAVKTEQNRLFAFDHAGIYFVQIMKDGKTVAVKKVVSK